MLWKQAVIIVTCALCSQSRFESRGFLLKGAQKKCPFPLNRDRDVPSTEVTNTNMSSFFRDNVLCPLIRGVAWSPWIEVSQKKRCILNKEIYVQNDNKDLLSLSFYKELRCQSVPAPKNGLLDCEQEGNSQAVRCQLKCIPGYDVTYLAAEYYVCNEDGSWSAEPSSAGTQWPDCKIYRLV